MHAGTYRVTPESPHSPPLSPRLTSRILFHGPTREQQLHACFALFAFSLLAFFWEDQHRSFQSGRWVEVAAAVGEGFFFLQIFNTVTTIPGFGWSYRIGGWVFWLTPVWWAGMPGGDWGRKRGG